MGQKLSLWSVAMLAMVIFAATVLGWRWLHTSADGPLFPVGLSNAVLPSPRPVQPFTLLDHNEKPFTFEQLRGHWTFLFFGYTHCPDICPMAMGVLGDVFRQLQEKAPNNIVNSQVLFVSVDPKRDTPAHIRQYVQFFNSDFKGLTGTDEQIRAFAFQIGATYFTAADFRDVSKGEAGKEAGGKGEANKEETSKDTGKESVSSSASAKSSQDDLISHTSAIFLLDPLGRLTAMFPEYNNAEKIAEEYGKIREYVRSRRLYGEASYNR
ncbi:SCO family protein [Candidatus Magnetaquicoccus inordinatus]|uniref:SCO family protein n=1 Tax=Candidatus Magnetaquicoccus inordinatus TaxID=2496818 RepID=UPI00102CD75F|nr:SCO family protein [Candidatus Magnetaquicoccus inordinatus]